MTDASAILAIAHRDLLKFLRDPARIVSTLIFPLLFIGALGGMMQSNLSDAVPYDFMAFVFTGIFGQTLFQSSALGVISLIEDRQNDFSQEIFVSPISRYSIVFGKILGESLVALPQGIAVIAFGVLLGVSATLEQLLALIPVALFVSLFGGAFGIIVLSNLGSQRAANQIFPFVMLPQFFLAGVFVPVKVLPLYLDIASRISPMRYAVDLVRGAFYQGSPDYSFVVLEPVAFNLSLMGALFAVFLIAGTFLFARAEQNR